MPGIFEIAVILVIAILVWGGDLPEVARKAARHYARLKNYLMQVRDEVMRQVPEEITNLPAVTEIPVYKDEPPGTVPVPEEPKVEEPPRPKKKAKKAAKKKKKKRKKKKA